MVRSIRPVRFSCWRARTLLRTQLPGRIQVLLAKERSFRLGGDAVACLGADGVDLERGEIIVWVNRGSKRGFRLRIRTRVATVKGGAGPCRSSCQTAWT